MNIVYHICCGVDVHKRFFVATLITTEGIEPKYKKRSFSTFNNEILKFKAWLLENNCRDVCMESTGKYWIPVSNLLEDSINVTIANPGNRDAPVSWLQFPHPRIHIPLEGYMLPMQASAALPHFPFDW